MTIHKDGVTVQLRDLLDGEDLNDAIVFARLQGHCTQATLFNCFGSWTKDGTGVILSSCIQSSLAAIGCVREDVGGHCCEFRLPGSEKWLNDRCFDLQHKEAHEMEIHFNAWESFETALVDGLTLERIYRASMPDARSGTESYKVIRRMAYRLRSNKRLALNDYWGRMVRLKRCFEFFMQHPLIYEEIKIYDTAPVTHYDPDIKIQYLNLFFDEQKKINPHDFLIYSHEVKNGVNELVRKCMKLMAEYPAPFDHYFHAFDHQRKDGVLHFVWNVAAVEELHKMRFGRKKLSLIDRLKAMRSRWARAFHQAPSDEVLTHIKDSRHYHAHAAADLRDKAAKGWLLLRYGDFLMALSNLEILSHLGFEEQEAINLTRHNHWMREALDLTTYPGGDD